LLLNNILILIVFILLPIWEIIIRLPWFRYKFKILPLKVYSFWR
ncbi:MAG: hypothetical protein BECKG1743D_GA0114223_104904, partial [Candidatus Kentron sp. G]